MRTETNADTEVSQNQGEKSTGGEGGGTGGREGESQLGSERVQRAGLMCKKRQKGKQGMFK